MRACLPATLELIVAFNPIAVCLNYVHVGGTPLWNFGTRPAVRTRSVLTFPSVHCVEATRGNLLSRKTSRNLFPPTSHRAERAS